MKKTLGIILLALITITTKVKAAEYIWPVSEKNAYETYIEYGYGDRTYNSTVYDKKYNYAPYEGKYSKLEPHFGIDITGIKGKSYDIISIVDGKVLTTSLDQIYNPSTKYVDRFQRRTSNDGGGYGNYIVIQEEKTGKCFLYAHLKANTITLRNGDKVSKGQKIGVMGSSGDAGHMHLHFEVRPSAKEVLPQFVFGGHKNLVVTYKYGVETLNPVNFIGSVPPAKKEEPKKEVKEETKPEVKTAPATIKNISYENNNTFGKIIIEFDKEIKVINNPTVEIKIGNETKNANIISNNNKQSIYTFRYDDFDVVTEGQILINIKDGKIVNKDDETVIANYTINNKQIGYLESYKIYQTYEYSVYNSLGDVNNDGMIDGSDATIAFRLSSKIIKGDTLSQEEQEQAKRADMDKDGTVTVIDGQLILNYYGEELAGITDKKQNKVIKCDFDRNEKITINDYNMLLSQINSYNLKYDLNDDGIVNNNDIEYFKSILKQYGKR